MQQGKTVRTLKAREQFLATLATGLSVAASAKAGGFSRSAAYAWREEDEDFRKAWDEVYEEATDAIEDVAMSRAMEKSDTLIGMFLKARRPQVYRERVQHEGNVNTTVSVEVREDFAK